MFLIIDAGTTAVKGVLLSTDGKRTASASASVSTFMEEGFVEQRPEDWETACEAVLAELHQQKPGHLASIHAVTFTGQMEDVIFPAEGRPAVLYSDQRAENEAAFLREKVPEIERQAGNPFSPSTPAAKLLWLQLNEPDLSGTVVFSSKDHLLYRWTGRFVTDTVTAATTGMMNLDKREWTADVLASIGVSHFHLPELLEPDERCGYTQQIPWLPDGVPVYCGTGDGGSTAAGAGVVFPGDAYMYIGTTGWTAAVVDKSGASQDHFLLPSPLHRGQLLAVVPLFNGGAVFDWLTETFARGERDRAEAWLEQLPAEEDALFHPALFGERYPEPLPRGSGRFHGIGPESTPETLFRSGVEGLCFSLCTILEEAALPEGRPLTVIGGAGSSSGWMQFLSTLSRRELYIPEDSSFLPALGAAAASGLIPPQTAGSCTVYTPDHAHLSTRYEGWKRAFLP
ncbi:xylulokinase [Alkalicoccus urumqiensis]|uniref:Carbohydrate kinase n=1 Tax=Alkalicoccus urumqiensis TaxID=1548213 RepID=A0A2P6MGZ1_ALKUR|nr:FGGY-family carbohydrate kinase [Alkalicoccus urumqiensis]PRO65556.1 hypothetical protein C6I21_08490 [Alkalicoccus urumqiensis]